MKSVYNFYNILFMHDSIVEVDHFITCELRLMSELNVASRYMYALKGLETGRLWPMSVFGALGVLLTRTGHGLPRGRTTTRLRTYVHRWRYESSGSIRTHDCSSTSPENDSLRNGSQQNLKNTVDIYYKFFLFSHRPTDVP